MLKFVDVSTHTIELYNLYYWFFINLYRTLKRYDRSCTSSARPTWASTFTPPQVKILKSQLYCHITQWIARWADFWEFVLMQVFLQHPKSKFSKTCPPNRLLYKMTIGLNLEKCVPVLGPTGAQECFKKIQRTAPYNCLHSTLCSKLPLNCRDICTSPHVSNDAKERWAIRILKSQLSMFIYIVYWVAIWLLRNLFKYPWPCWYPREFKKISNVSVYFHLNGKWCSELTF